MADEDDFVRITLRIPRALHELLNDSAAKKRSMNAEIIDRLEATFLVPPLPEAIAARIEDISQLMQEMRNALVEADRRTRENTKIIEANTKRLNDALAARQPK